MGLTIHYSLRLGADVAASTAEARVRAMHAAMGEWARQQAGASITDVMLATEHPFCLRWVLVEVGEHASRGVEVEPLDGWCFSIHPGADCESATFGLCRYPASVLDGPRHRATEIKPGWAFTGACKTQYASRHGWPHFLHCHRAIIDLAELWRVAGAEVTITDEGNYWPDRDEDTLRRALGMNNAAVAALAGRLRDTHDDSTGTPRVQSPIFGYPDFERLEHDGAQRYAAALAQAEQTIKTMLDRPRDGTDGTDL